MARLAAAWPFGTPRAPATASIDLISDSRITVFKKIYRYKKDRWCTYIFCKPRAPATASIDLISRLTWVMAMIMIQERETADFNVSLEKES